MKSMENQIMKVSLGTCTPCITHLDPYKHFPLILGLTNYLAVTMVNNYTLYQCQLHTLKSKHDL